jgi:DNA recombination protein RmuC
VSKQLENVYRSLGEMKELSAGVTDNVSALNRVLTNVKARGTWAEVQLRAILDQTVPGMYDCNVKTSPFSADLVEFAVKIPSKDEPGKYAWLPVDSKFPMESYIRLCTASENADAAAADAARKELERAVLNEGKKITKYINEPLTTPFAIMYLATEGLYAEIVSSKQGIAEKLTNEMNVMVAGPTTVTALLNTIAMGFRAAAVNEKASEVRKLLITARVQYEKFGETLDRARSKMDDAAKAIDDASKRNDIIKTKLKNAGEIEAGSLKQKEFISDEEAYAAEETLEEDAASKFNE